MEKLHADLLHLTEIDRDTGTIRFLYEQSGLSRSQVQTELESLEVHGWIVHTPQDRWLITAPGRLALEEAEHWVFRVHSVEDDTEQSRIVRIAGDEVRGNVSLLDNFTIWRKGQIVGGGSIIGDVRRPADPSEPVTLMCDARRIAPGDELHGEDLVVDEYGVSEDLAPLDYLVAWYEDHCDDDWEHAFGVSLTTIDNPGWHLKVELTETGLEGSVIPLTRIDRSDRDWVEVKCDGSIFEAYGGAGNLEELLVYFRDFSVRRSRFMES